MQAIETSKEEPTTKNEPSKAATTAPPKSKAYGIGMIGCAVFNFLGFVGIIVAYLVFINIADEQLSDATQVRKAD